MGDLYLCVGRGSEIGEWGEGWVNIGDVWQVAKSRGEEPGLRGGGGDWRSCAAN